MDPKDFADQIEKLGTIVDPVRRRLYLFVCSQPDEVSRDRAAEATGVARALAAFHLDKLVEAGLLEAAFRRLSARTGPGAGRPSKLYRRANAQMDVTLPERRYEWAAQMLMRAVGESAAPETLAALKSAARSQGERIGRDLAGASRAADPLRRAARALETCGFQPERTADGHWVLRNCPFDSLREGCREVTCGMNLSLIEGVLVGIGEPEVSASLEPQPDHCCVALRPRPAAGA